MSINPTPIPSPTPSLGKVYLVDDEPIVLKAIGQSLKSIGCEVITFEKGADCLAQLCSVSCDIIITDVNMPTMNGLELVERVKKTKPLIPILVISGYGDIPIAIQAIKLGAVDFIEKPLDEETFLPRVKAILDQKCTLPYVELTPTELDILQSIAAGKANKEIAFLLDRSVRTIENHRQSILIKLKAENSADLIRRAIAFGLVKPEI